MCVWGGGRVHYISQYEHVPSLITCEATITHFKQETLSEQHLFSLCAARSQNWSRQIWKDATPVQKFLAGVCIMQESASVHPSNFSTELALQMSLITEAANGFHFLAINGSLAPRSNATRKYQWRVWFFLSFAILICISKPGGGGGHDYHVKGFPQSQFFTVRFFFLSCFLPLLNFHLNQNWIFRSMGSSGGATMYYGHCRWRYGSGRVGCWKTGTVISYWCAIPDSTLPPSLKPLGCHIDSPLDQTFCLGLPLEKVEKPELMQNAADCIAYWLEPAEYSNFTLAFTPSPSTIEVAGYYL